MEKKNLQKEQVFKGKVNDVEVSGKTYKDFAINYLTELVNQYKNLPDKKRIKAYVDYFVKNFNYDNELRDVILQKEQKQTRENNEELRFKLLFEGHGVCQQLAEALTLLSSIDNKLIPNSKFKITFAGCDIKVKGKPMGHAFNLCFLKNELLVIDTSSMIHARNKEYEQNMQNFYMVTIDDYEQALEKQDIKITTCDSKNRKYLMYFVLQHKPDPDLTYSILNLTVDEINDNEEFNLALVKRVYWGKELNVNA